MESKDEFFRNILGHYLVIVGDRIQLNLLEELCKIISTYYFDQYIRFRNQYPKSFKRYSSFQTKDLSHPDIYELIINYFKDKLGGKYEECASEILQMSKIELKQFEMNRELYHYK